MYAVDPYKCSRPTTTSSNMTTRVHIPRRDAAIVGAWLVSTLIKTQTSTRRPARIVL